MNATPKTAIVVLNWNGKADTLACLDSLRQMDYPAHRVIVVDNGSSDDSVAAIREAHPWVHLIENGANLGFAGGNNVGIRAALETDTEFVMLLNNDTLIAPDCIDHLVEAAQAHRDVGILGARIFYMESPDVVWFDRAVWNRETLRFDFPGQGETETKLSEQPLETEYVCGAAMFFRAEVARRIGLLDKRFFLVYEESDWCFTARDAGYRCLTIPKARVWHRVGASFGSEQSPLRAYFTARNRLLWMEKNRTSGELLRALWQSALGLLPPLLPGSDTTFPLIKRLAWWPSEVVRNLARLNANPVVIARRLGIAHYLLRRFGDCPPQVRSLTKAWASKR